MNKDAKMTAKTRYRGIRVPAELDHLIEAESKKQNTTYSAVVIQALRYELIPDGKSYKLVDQLLDM